MKKKLFTLLTALVLSIGIGWAADWSWTANQWVGSTYVGYWNANAGKAVVYYFNWGSGNPKTSIVLCFLDAEKVTYNGKVLPPKGTYPISKNENVGYAARYQGNDNVNWVYNNSRYCSYVNNSSGTQYKFYSGDIIFDEGIDGPYVYSSSLELANNAFTSTLGSGSITCGTKAVYRTVNVVSNNTTMGTVSYTYKSGYVYANNRSQEFKKGSVYTLTATKRDGYRFVNWTNSNGDEVTRNESFDLQIDGNETYTANFELAATEATITTSAGVGGTVGGDAGKYDTKTQHTITATANPGYAFAYWEDANHNIVSNNASYTFTLMTDVNYKAIFHADGTITVNSNNTDWGTVTGGGSYAGNTQVTLTATPKSGYGFIRWSDNNTENPRTITVDGDFEVTAIFEQMIVVNLEEGTIEGNKSYWCTVTGSNSEYDFSFNFDENFYSGNKNYTTMDRNTEYSWVRKAGGAKRQIQAGYVVSIDFNTTFRRAVLNAQFTDEDGQKYQVRIITNKIGSTNWYDDVERYNGYPSNMGDGNMTFSYGETDVTVGSNYVIMNIKKDISDDYGTHYQAGLFFNHSGEIKSGVYPIQGTANFGTMTVGGYDNSGFAGTWARYTCGTMGQTGTAYWLLRSGTVTLKWKDQKHYYAVVDAYAANGQHITYKVGNEADVPTITHDVTFKVEGQKDVVIQVAEGEVPVYPNAEPTKDATVDKVYTFTGWNDGTTDYAKDATLPAVGSDDVTYTATFSETTRQYAITITAATNGTIKVMNGNTEVQTGDKVDYNTVLTVTTTPSTGYHFDAWTTGTGYVTPNEQGQVTVTGDIKLGATFAINTYTVTIDATENGEITMLYGEETQYEGKEGDVIDNIPYGTEITFTAVPDQGYVFSTWTNEEGGGDFEPDAPKRVGFESPIPFVNEGEAMVLTEDQLTSNPLVIMIDGDLNIGAMFEMLPPFTVTIHETYDGYISVSDGETTVTNQKGEKVVEFPQNTQLTLTLHPDNSENQYVDFGEWVNNYDDDVAYSEEQERVVTLTEDMDLYADFMMKEFTIYESGVEANYDRLPKEVLIRRVTLVRTFKKGTWSTMCLPFDNYVGDNAQLSGKIHEMFNAEVSGNKVDVYFNRVNAISAGYPYMYYSSESGVTNPVFNYVYAEEGVTAQKPNCGDMTYCGVLTSFVLPAHDENYRYISSNKLYYPTKDYPVPFDRGYFEINKAFSNAPIRMFVEDSMIEEADQSEEIGTKKYIEDGILVIERNDVKYNAQGQMID